MLVTVGRFLDPWEAYVVRARLEAEGVPATVAFASHAILNWPMSLALQGTSVQVPENFFAQSGEILSDYSSGTFERELNEATGSQSEHCSRCGSTNFRRTMPLHKRMLAILIIFFLTAFPTSRNRFVCRECGHEWDWGEG
jgi:hypothetical protein